MFRPTLITNTDVPAKVRMQSERGEFTLELKARINGDNSVSTYAVMVANDIDGLGLLTEKHNRRFPSGQITRVMGMTNSNDEYIRLNAQNGDIITNQGPHSGFYLKVRGSLYEPIPPGSKPMLNSPN